MKTKTKSLTINYDQLQDMIVAHLYAIGALDDGEDVISLDIDIALNDDGLVEMDVETMPLKRGSHLTGVSSQAELPLNA